MNPINNLIHLSLHDPDKFKTVVDNHDVKNLLPEFLDKAALMGIGDFVDVFQNTKEIASLEFEDRHFESAIQASCEYLYKILSIKKGRIVASMISRGYWPGRDDHYIHGLLQDGYNYMDRPGSILEAAGKLISAREKTVITLYKMYLLTNSMDNVVEDLHSTDPGLVILFDLYPESQLMRYAKSHPCVGARLLENGLGL